MTWFVLDTGTELHVLPENDLYEHVERGCCWCSPVKDEESLKDIYEHRAFDCRDQYELGSRKTH